MGDEHEYHARNLYFPEYFLVPIFVWVNLEAQVIYFKKNRFLNSLAATSR